MAKISIIVPVYKVEAYLDRCVESILAQTYSDFELILVDDGSPDRCGEMCEAWAKRDSRIVVLHRENGGLSAARNTGIKWAKENSDSGWMTFVDSDDWIHCRMLEELYRGASLCDVKMSACGYFRAERYEKAELLGDVDLLGFKVLGPEEFLDDCFNWTGQGIFVQNVAWGKLYAKSCFECVEYPEDVKAHEDVYTTYKIVFGLDKVALTHAQMYFYYQNPQSITGVCWSPKRLHTVWGHQEQIEYFERNGFNKALEIAVRQQFERLLWAMDMSASAPECVPYVEKLRTMLISNYAKYSPRISFPLPRYFRVWQVVKPVRARIYWIYKRIRELGFCASVCKIVRKALRQGEYRR